MSFQKNCSRKISIRLRREKSIEVLSTEISFAARSDLWFLDFKAYLEVTNRTETNAVVYVITLVYGFQIRNLMDELIIILRSLLEQQLTTNGCFSLTHIDCSVTNL